MARRFSSLGMHELKKIGVVLKKARYFIAARGQDSPLFPDLGAARVRALLSVPGASRKAEALQLKLAFES